MLVAFHYCYFTLVIADKHTRKFFYSSTVVPNRLVRRGKATGNFPFVEVRGDTSEQSFGTAFVPFLISAKRDVFWILVSPPPPPPSSPVPSFPSLHRYLPSHDRLLLWKPTSHTLGLAWTWVHFREHRSRNLRNVRHLPLFYKWFRRS